MIAATAERKARERAEKTEMQLFGVKIEVLMHF